MKLVACIASALLLFSATTQKETGMVKTSAFGTLNDGRTATLYTLENRSGATVAITDFGAAVVAIKVPDRHGVLKDVILGYDSVAGYVPDRAYFGAIVGRYGNRIGHARFTLDGQEYKLATNDGPNSLHGGVKGFNKVLWKAEQVADTAGPSLRLTYVSKDGEEGFPGTVTLHVTYTWTNENALRIVYEGTTDKPTVLNPTNHSYFNLSGDLTHPILDELLTIEADSVTPVDRGLIPTGKLLDVTNTPMDFRTPTAIGARINEPYEQLVFGRGYDHNWALRGKAGVVRKAAKVEDPTSGRVLTVLTDQPGIQFYSGNFLDGHAHGKGVAFNHRTGLCLEAQVFPDAPNKPNFPSAVLRPGEVYHQTTIYQFSTN